MQPENGAGLFNCSTASVTHTGFHLTSTVS